MTPQAFRNQDSELYKEELEEILTMERKKIMGTKLTDKTSVDQIICEM